jgi:hypothetical protein
VPTRHNLPRNYGDRWSWWRSVSVKYVVNILFQMQFENIPYLSWWSDPCRRRYVQVLLIDLQAAKQKGRDCSHKRGGSGISSHSSHIFQDWPPSSQWTKKTNLFQWFLPHLCHSFLSKLILTSVDLLPVSSLIQLFHAPRVHGVSKYKNEWPVRPYKPSRNHSHGLKNAAEITHT